MLGSDPAVLGGPDLLHQISQVPYLSADSLGFLLELPVCLLQLGALGVQRLLLGAFLLPVPRRCRLVLLHLLLFLMHHFRSIRVGSGVGFGSGGACRLQRGFGDPAVAVRRVAATRSQHDVGWSQHDFGGLDHTHLAAQFKRVAGIQRLGLDLHGLLKVEGQRSAERE